MELTRAERFERLFRDTYREVRAYALRRAPAEVAQDVAAETFLVAWRRLEDVPDDALPWLFGVARRVLANERRSAGRGAALERQLVDMASRARPGDPAEAIDDAELMRAALARLPEGDREVLMLVAWQGLSNARAARVVGCTRAAFAVRLHRARARLRAEVHQLETAPGGVGAATAEGSR